MLRVFAEREQPLQTGFALSAVVDQLSLVEVLFSGAADESEVLTICHVSVTSSLIRVIELPVLQLESPGDTDFGPASLLAGATIRIA